MKKEDDEEMYETTLEQMDNNVVGFFQHNGTTFKLKSTNEQKDQQDIQEEEKKLKVTFKKTLPKELL